MGKSVDKARIELREQLLKNPANYMEDTGSASIGPVQDPDEEDEPVTSHEEIWKLLPQLQGVPEATLKKLPLAAIFQLSNALAKSS